MRKATVFLVGAFPHRLWLEQYPVFDRFAGPDFGQRPAGHNVTQVIPLGLPGIEKILESQCRAEADTAERNKKMIPAA